MPFPLPADDAGPIDLEHLRRMTLGDAGLEREVLAMFARQASQLAAALATAPPEASALVHTLKGSARAIGAIRVAEAAAGLEAAIRDGQGPAQALGVLRDTVAEADAAIATLLRRSSPANASPSCGFRFDVGPDRQRKCQIHRTSADRIDPL